MKTPGLSSAIGISIVATWLAGCGGGLSTAPSESNYVPGARTFSAGIADVSGYRVLHSFRDRDGAYPLASLVALKGALYGTTSGGGTHGTAFGDGVVFSVSTDGTERVLHDFGTGRDGSYPGAALLEVDGALYGTTELGNNYNTGTIFSVTVSGVEHLPHRFGEFSPSPMQPSANLIDLNGSLYSTSNFGGRSGLGTVFSISTSGKERVLHSFGQPYRTDGQIPAAGLIEISGTLYGTTYEGGVYGRARQCNGSPCPGDGTVFSISQSGKERVLHSFGGASDGINPTAGLLDVNGTLYGTTNFGGKYGAGTIFSISTTGKERVLYSFGATTGDGGVPMAGLVRVGGRFYGTTAGGGAYRYYGTVFSIGITGEGEQVLHSFGASKDGATPEASLLYLNGTFYGTTDKGGTANHGTIFALTR